MGRTRRKLGARSTQPSLLRSLRHHDSRIRVLDPSRTRIRRFRPPRRTWGPSTTERWGLYGPTGPGRISALSGGMSPRLRGVRPKSKRAHWPPFELSAWAHAASAHRNGCTAPVSFREARLRPRRAGLRPREQCGLHSGRVSSTIHGLRAKNEARKPSLWVLRARVGDVLLEGGGEEVAA